VTFPEPPGSTAITAIRDAIGQRVDVAGVEPLDGIPLVTATDGRRILCSTPWSAAGATYLEGELKTNGATPIPVQVVEENGFIGFRPVKTD
jgi:hypothetical protein